MKIWNSLFGKIILTFLISMVPVLELRGAIPIGVAHGLDYRIAIAVSILGNLVPVPFIVLFIRKIFAWLRTKSETATIAARAMTSAASVHILFFDRLCSVKAGAFVDVPTGRPLLFCRYEPLLCLPCQPGEEDGLWRVATLLPTVAGS